MTEAINTTQDNGVNQADYMKLFMQELTYQDPLKPIDNREFMAQMAQISTLQQTQVTNDSLINLMSMTSANQSLMMLGKKVKMKDSDEYGIVREIQFNDNAPLMLSIDIKGGRVQKQLSEIINVAADNV